MKIFVTGGCGFIGSNFVLQQVSAGDNIILNLDKLTYAGNPENLTSIENHPNYEFIQADICDIKTVTNTIEKFQPDAIVHFAAESHVDRSIDLPMDFIQTNVIGTTMLLEAAMVYWNFSKKAKFKFLHVSTDEVFGSLENDGFMLFSWLLAPQAKIFRVPMCV